MAILTLKKLIGNNRPVNWCLLDIVLMIKVLIEQLQR